MNTLLPTRLNSRTLHWAGLGLFLLALLAAFLFEQWLWLALPFAMVFASLFILDIRFAFWTLVACIPWSFNLEEQLHMGIDFPSEPLMLLITVSALFWFGFQVHKVPWRSYFNNPLVVVVLLSLVWTLISVLYSENPALSVKFLLKKIWYLLPFFIYFIKFFSKFFSF